MASFTPIGLDSRQVFTPVQTGNELSSSKPNILRHLGTKNTKHSMNVFLNAVSSNLFVDYENRRSIVSVRNVEGTVVNFFESNHKSIQNIFRLSTDILAVISEPENTFIELWKVNESTADILGVHSISDKITNKKITQIIGLYSAYYYCAALQSGDLIVKITSGTLYIKGTNPVRLNNEAFVYLNEEGVITKCSSTGSMKTFDNDFPAKVTKFILLTKGGYASLMNNKTIVVMDESAQWLSQSPILSIVPEQLIELPDTKILAHDYKTILCFNSCGKEIYSYQPHNGSVFSHTTLKSGIFVTWSNEDKSIKLWDLSGEIERCLHTLLVECSVDSVIEFENDMLITNDGTDINLWRIAQTNAV